jgi:transcriptional regulator with XRE-family HTH domain
MQHINNLPALGVAVAHARKDRGMTQSQLASVAGLAQSTLARFETGKVGEFGSRKLLRLLEILGLELSLVPVSQTFTLDDALKERELEAAADERPPRRRRTLPTTP